MSKLIIYNNPPLNNPPRGLIEFYLKVETEQYLKSPRR